MPDVQVYQTTWQLKCPLCRCIRPRGNWKTLCAGVSDHVATEMPSVQVYQTTWQLKFPLCRSIRTRGNWNAFFQVYQNMWQLKCRFSGVSDHVATEKPSVQVYQTTWQLKSPLCRCIRPRGNWNFLCAEVSEHVATEMPFSGVSEHVATEITSVQGIITRVNIFETLTLTVSTVKHRILWISISYRRSSCSSASKKTGDGLCSLL